MICTDMHRYALACTYMHRNAPKCTDMHRYAPIHTDMHRYAPTCTDMHIHAHKCTDMHRHEPTCTDIYVYAPTCSDMQRNVSLCTDMGIHNTRRKYTSAHIWASGASTTHEGITRQGTFGHPVHLQNMKDLHVCTHLDIMDINNTRRNNTSGHARALWALTKHEGCVCMGTSGHPGHPQHTQYLHIWAHVNMQCTYKT